MQHVCLAVDQQQAVLELAAAWANMLRDGPQDPGKRLQYCISGSIKLVRCICDPWIFDDLYEFVQVVHWMCPF